MYVLPCQGGCVSDELFSSSWMGLGVRAIYPPSDSELTHVHCLVLEIINLAFILFEFNGYDACYNVVTMFEHLLCQGNCDR